MWFDQHLSFERMISWQQTCFHASQLLAILSARAFNSRWVGRGPRVIGNKGDAQMAGRTVLSLCLLIVMVLCVGATAAWVGGCGSGEDSLSKEMLELSWREFDQSPGAGWRAIADRGEYVRAAGLIEHYLGHKTGLEQGQIAYLHFHAAVLHAYEDDYDPAIAHLRVASVDSFPPGFPQSWNALVKGELAFMLKDMDGVRSARDEVAAMRSLTARDSMFLMGLEYLATMEGVSYKEAMKSMEE
jgi:hypothetical protein